MADGCFYGVPNVRFIWHGTQSDPEVECNGVVRNYYDVEGFMYDLFVEDMPDTVGTSHEQDRFEEYVRENAEWVYNQFE